MHGAGRPLDVFIIPRARLAVIELLVESKPIRFFAPDDRRPARPAAAPRPSGRCAAVFQKGPGPGRGIGIDAQEIRFPAALKRVCSFHPSAAGPFRGPGRPNHRGMSRAKISGSQKHTPKASAGILAHFWSVFFVLGSSCQAGCFRSTRNTFEPVRKASSAIHGLGGTHGLPFCTRSQNAHSC